MSAIMRKRANGEVEYFAPWPSEERILQKISNYTEPYTRPSRIEKLLATHERVATKYSQFFLSEKNK